MKRNFIFLITIFCFLSLFTRPVFADVGPKPSVTIIVENAPEKSYYVTLLAKSSYGPWHQVAGIEEMPVNSEEEKRAAQLFLDYEDKNGFFLLSNMSGDLKGKNEFSWTYYPPEEFKVAICTPDDGTVYVSEALEREAFYSYFRVTYGSDPLVAQEESHLGRVFLESLLRVAVTIAVELFLAYLFGYREKKQLLTIGIVNIVTQMILNAFLVFCDYFGGALMWMIMFPIGEIIVFVIELIVYLFTIGKGKKGKAFLYTLLANAASAAFTFIGMVAAWAR